MADCKTIFHQMLKLIPRPVFLKFRGAAWRRTPRPELQSVESVCAPLVYAVDCPGQPARRCAKHESQVQEPLSPGSEAGSPDNFFGCQ